MKTLGFILIAIQIIGYASGEGNFQNESFAYILGFNLWGIIGVILLIQSSSGKYKQPPHESKDNMNE